MEVSRKIFLNSVAFCIRNNGWISKQKSEKISVSSTFDYVWDALVENKSLNILKVDEDLVNNAIEWYLTTECDEKSKELLQLESINEEQAATISPFIINYKHHIINQQCINSTWLGKEAEKLFLEKVKCIYISAIVSEYGLSHLHKFVDSNNNLIIWFSSSKKLIENNIYDIIGTVKKHDIYEGIKQTIINRCKVMAVNKMFF